MLVLFLQEKRRVHNDLMTEIPLAEAHDHASASTAPTESYRGIARVQPYAPTSNPGLILTNSNGAYGNDSSCHSLGLYQMRVASRWWS